MLRPGQAYGPYILVRKLGTGGFGEVWLAEKRSAATGLAFRYALKIALEEEAVAGTFVKEVMSWVASSGHPNVLSIVDADVWEGMPCIVSEYCPEGSLSDWLRAHDGGAPSREAAAEMAAGILEGLAHLHERGVLHGDLKPVNILLQGRKPRIADFGLARVLLSSRHRSTVAGTPVYMAPEAFDGVSTVQTDLWSAGVILYQMVEKRLPYPHGSPAVVMKAMLTHEPDPLSPSTPGGLRRVVARALAREPERRYPSAESMRADLRAWSTGRDGEEAADSASGSPPPATPSGHPAERSTGSDPDETGRASWPPMRKEKQKETGWVETPTFRQPPEELTVRDLPQASSPAGPLPPARTGWTRRLLLAAGLLAALLAIVLQNQTRPVWPGRSPAAGPTATATAQAPAAARDNHPGK